MRAAAIFGPASSEKELKAFQLDGNVSWQVGMPTEFVDAVLIFGGDGTLHRHLPELVKRKAPVLVVPHGSGNDFARALGLRSYRDSLAAWRKFAGGAGNVRSIDVGVVQSGGREHYFCTVAGVGIDGEVARRANRLPRWLRANGGYVLALLPLIFKFAALPMKVTFPNSGGDGGFGPMIQVSFANVPAYGGGMKIAPRAKLDDGHLDICVIRDIHPFKLLFAFPTIYFGRHLGIKEVEYFQAERARLDSPQPLDVYADGEYLCQTPIEVSVKRSAIQVIVP